MKIIILGSGGSIPLPRPLCDCKNCSLARERGIPYARTGPSMFLVDEYVLFDTPEEIRYQLEREKVKELKHVFYTHWHPDHTQGMRIFEHLNFSYDEDKPPIDVYIPENEIPDFERFCPSIFFFEKMKYIRINKIGDRQPVQIGNVKITPLDFKRPDRVRYCLLYTSPSPRD